MPAKNIVKTYVENGYYHIYNRGVEKRYIFQEIQDYSVFLSYLKTYLSPPDLHMPKVPPSRILNNYAEEINLLCYCLMPNHFHLLVHQHSNRAIVEFTRSLLTRYSMYFNKKYDRIGSLFQGTFKAVLVNSEEQLVYLSRYIHRNPSPTGFDPEVFDYPYSSIRNYLHEFTQSWLKTDEILSLFSTMNLKLTYKTFIESSTRLGPEGLLIDQ